MVSGGPVCFTGAMPPTLDQLQAMVETRYALLGPPAWPDPHPDRSPAEEEYSRVTNPSRHRIVVERARVWAEVLGEQLPVRVEALGALEVAEGEVVRSYARGLRLVPEQPETLSLLLLEEEWEGMASLAVAIDDPAVLLAVLPDCGCDACDSGSADLLLGIDDEIRAVVGGPFVVLRGEGWGAEWHPDGGSSHEDGPGPDRHFALMEMCRALAAGLEVELPAETRAYVGHSWVGQ